MAVVFMNVVFVTELTSGYELKDSDWASQEPIPTSLCHCSAQKAQGPHTATSNAWDLLSTRQVA